jgi:hypothetical protein
LQGVAQALILHAAASDAAKFSINNPYQLGLGFLVALL